MKGQTSEEVFINVVKRINLYLIILGVIFLVYFVIQTKVNVFLFLLALLNVGFALLSHKHIIITNRLAIELRRAKESLGDISKEMKDIHSILLIPFLFLGIFSFSEKNISISAESVILMSPWTKRVIYSKDPDLRLSPASTAKIVTALLVLKNSSLDKEVIVSKFATSMEPSKVYIKEGEVYSTRDLLKALLLNSGNDASVALAESIAGSEEEFVKMMNAMAIGMGAKDTNFKTSNGLPAEDQYSTARDLALIVREAMRHKEFVEIIKMKKGEISELKSGRRIKLKSHNKSLWKDTPYRVLGKTGYTKKAGSCFAGYIEYNRWRKVIVVVLKSKAKWKDLDTLAKGFL